MFLYENTHFYQKLLRLLAWFRFQFEGNTTPFAHVIYASTSLTSTILTTNSETSHWRTLQLSSWHGPTHTKINFYCCKQQLVVNNMDSNWSSNVRRYLSWTRIFTQGSSPFYLIREQVGPVPNAHVSTTVVPPLSLPHPLSICLLHTRFATDLRGCDHSLWVGSPVLGSRDVCLPRLCITRIPCDYFLRGAHDELHLVSTLKLDTNKTPPPHWPFSFCLERRRLDNSTSDHHLKQLSRGRWFFKYCYFYILVGAIAPPPR